MKGVGLEPGVDADVEDALLRLDEEASLLPAKSLQDAPELEDHRVGGVVLQTAIDLERRPPSGAVSLDVERVGVSRGRGRERAQILARDHIKVDVREVGWLDHVPIIRRTPILVQSLLRKNG